MIDLRLWLVPLGVVLLLALLYVERLEDDASLRLWRWGFVSLYTGAVVGVVPTWLPGQIVALPLLTAFVGLMFAGAVVFAGRRIPRWLLPLTLAVGLVRAGMGATGYMRLSAALAILFALPLFTAGGAVVWRGARERGAGLAELVLGPTLVGFGVLLCMTVGLRLSGTPEPAELVPVWISFAGTVALLQIVAGFERVRARERQQTQALEEERRTLRAVVETAPLDIVLRGEDGRVHMANRSAAARFGLVLQDGDALRVDGAFPHALLNGRGPNGADSDPLEIAGEGVTLHTGSALPDHEDETLQLFSSPVLTDTGESLGRLFISRDVTQEHRLQQQLIESQKMETLGTLAGGVAHDFNNQLTTILGNARFALDELPPEQGIARECLGDLERAAEHCAELTQGLLAFARRTPGRTRALSVSGLVDEVERLLRAMLPSPISLRVELPEQPWHPDADPTQLQQALLNLAVNSRDAIADAGEIVIRVENCEFHEPIAVVSGDAPPGRYVIFEVCDDGCGIESEPLERIFEPFFTTKSTGEGTGLGLAIAYGVVTSHGGFLDVQSKPGRTSIRIGIPACDSLPLELAANPEHMAEGRECVLLVDDEAALRRVVRSQLEGLGYRVLDAPDGEAAIELLADRGDEIDVAVLDYAMPGLDGLATLKRLREQRPQLPAVMISGYLDQEVVGRVQDDMPLVQKPFDAKQLGRAIRRSLQR